MSKVSKSQTGWDYYRSIPGLALRPVLKTQGRLFAFLGIFISVVCGLWAVIEKIELRGTELKASLKCEAVSYFETINGKEVAVNLDVLLENFSQLNAFQNIINEHPGNDRLSSEQKSLITKEFSELKQRIAKIETGFELRVRIKNLGNAATTIEAAEVKLILDGPTAEEVFRKQSKQSRQKFHKPDTTHAASTEKDAGENAKPFQLPNTNVHLPLGAMVEETFRFKVSGIPDALFWGEWAYRQLAKTEDRDAAITQLKSVGETTALTAFEGASAISSIVENRAPTLVILQLTGMLGEQIELTSDIPLQMGRQLDFSGKSWSARDPEKLVDHLHSLSYGVWIFPVGAAVGGAVAIYLRRKRRPSEQVKIVFLQWMTATTAAVAILQLGVICEGLIMHFFTEKRAPLPLDLDSASARLPSWVISQSDRSALVASQGDSPPFTLELKIHLLSSWPIALCGILGASVFVISLRRQTRFQNAFWTFFILLCLVDFYSYIAGIQERMENRFVIGVACNFLGSLIHVVFLEWIINKATGVYRHFFRPPISV